MPSAAARQLTAAHRRQLEQLSRMVRGRISRIAAGASAADIDAWWASVEPQVIRLIERGSQAAATLAESYLRRHAALEGVDLSPVRSLPERAVVRESLRVTGPVAFKTNISLTGDEGAATRAMQQRMAGAAVRQTLAGERATVMQTVYTRRSQVAGYRRATGPSPCAFCAMLASRGAVYTRESATTVIGRSGGIRGTREAGESYHDHCQCTPEPVYEVEDEPPEVDALREQWESVASGHSGADAMRAWRRHWEDH